MSHPVTIDKCQGCKHWHLGIADEECALCHVMPFRDNGHPYNYDQEVIITTTITEGSDTKPRRNCERFSNSNDALQAWERESVDVEWLKRHNLYWERFSDWLFEYEGQGG